jgi:hypothetical protein
VPWQRKKTLSCLMFLSRQRKNEIGCCGSARTATTARNRWGATEIFQGRRGKARQTSDRWRLRFCHGLDVRKTSLWYHVKRLGSDASRARWCVLYIIGQRTGLQKIDRYRLWVGRYKHRLGLVQHRSSTIQFLTRETVDCMIRSWRKKTSYAR